MNNYRDGCHLGIKLASMVVVTIGTLVAVNANGYGVTATSPNAVKLMGMAQHDADNSQGVDGEVTVVVGRNQQYLLPFDADNPLTQAYVGKTALLTPNQTIVTSGNGLLQVGQIMSIEPDGYAWVEIGFENVSYHIGLTSPSLPSQMPTNLVPDTLINCTYDKATGELIYTGGKLAFPQADGSTWDVNGAAATIALPANEFIFTTQRANSAYSLSAIFSHNPSALEVYVDNMSQSIRLGVVSIDGLNDIFAYHVKNDMYSNGSAFGNTDYTDIVSIDGKNLIITHTDGTKHIYTTSDDILYLHLFAVNEFGEANINDTNIMKLTRGN